MTTATRLVYRSFAALALVVALAGCDEEEARPDDDLYDETLVVEHRQEKDDAFRRSDDSPIPAELRDRFDGLRYFLPDAAYAVWARWTDAGDHPEQLSIGTSHGGEARTAYRAGVLTFRVNGADGRLHAYRFASGANTSSTVFVPFTDPTNGSTTYEAGRYLDIDIADGTDSVLVDFNEAYNPYCAYNVNYSCPIVPSENRLPMAIKAGERTWH